MPKYVNTDDMNFVFYSLYEGTDEDGNEVYRRTEVAIKGEVEAMPPAQVVSLDEYNALKAKLNAAESCIDDIEDALNRGSDNSWARSAIVKYYSKIAAINSSPK